MCDIEFSTRRLVCAYIWFKLCSVCGVERCPVWTFCWDECCVNIKSSSSEEESSDEEEESDEEKVIEFKFRSYECRTNSQWRRYTRTHQVKWPGWKIHRRGSSPGSALPSPAYRFASVISQLLNLCKTLTPPISGIHRIYMWVRSVSRCYRPWNSRKIRCSLFLFSVKNAKIAQPWVLT